jgi:folate-binding protein YgfZ
MYELIQIGGNDASDFLQGQLTQDVAKLDAATSLPAAWCNPKGRVITVLRLLAMPDSIGLVVPASLAESVAQRLVMFRFRSDVSIERTAGNWTCIAVSDAQAIERLDAADLLPAANAARTNGRLIAVDYSAADRFVEIFGDEDALMEAGLRVDAPLSALEWNALRIRAGLADITLASTEKYTPHMLNLDHSGAISFNKGCYTGQEVVARTENLGESKRRLMRYQCDAPGIAIGDKLADDGRDVGAVVNVAGSELLAVTPVAIHGQPLAINGAIATPVALRYASFKAVNSS